MGKDNKRVDLHVHTYYSDGTFSPEKAVATARVAGLSAIAICDHDCVDGMQEALEASERYGVEIVPGVEVTCEHNGLEIHMLGYFIDPASGPMKKLLSDLRDKRIKRIHTMVDKLKKHNVNISSEDVFKISGKGAVSRLHLAKAMYKAGFVSSVKEAFNKYIGDGMPCYAAKFDVSPEKAIKTILGSGGVPVLAHPAVMGRDSLIVDFMKSGLRGIEAYHTDHNKATSKRYSEMAEKLGLLVTGGSDCHGAGKGRILMGGTTMPYSTLERLRKEAGEVRKG